jgi:uncharacterized protein
MTTRSLLALLVLLTAACGERATFVTIGTGGLTGVYYPTGGAIARMVNDHEEYGLRATVEATGGSVFNINAILAGDMEFGIVQSDRQYQAVNGLAEWADKGPQSSLRAVFSIHPEAVTLVAADDAGITTIADLRGKRVNIGMSGSGHRQNAIDALTAAGIDYERDLDNDAVQATEAPGRLQDGRVDAYFYTVGHPNGSMKEATAGVRKVHLVPIPVSAELLAEHPYYAKARIPISHYTSATNTEDVWTFGVKATLLTSASVPEEIVYAITKEVFTNLETFRTLHPSYETLTAESMLEGLTAPLHPGAERYYREAGLLK